MMTRYDRGIALISTFMVLGMLFMMALSMILMSRQRVFVGMGQYHQAQALYLAEAGMARAQAALESDINWSGVKDATIDGMPGKYTVEFKPGKMGSVRNLGNMTGREDSYHGEGSVPENSALLVVEANVSGHRYVLESLVEGQGSVGYVTDAILASGKVRAKGDLKVDGIAALDDSASVDGSIQSNDGGTEDVVVWEGGGEALITGHVGIKGSTGDAINMVGATILGGPELNSLSNIPKYDITSEVEANLGHPVPTIVEYGTTTLSGGKYTLPGGAINGDIVLADGATLYVDGDISINGSISGSGNVYVKGKTSFYGDSEISTNPDKSVSLYSKGDVTLSGFDGTKFLEDNPETAALLDDAEFSLKHLQVGLSVTGGEFTGIKPYLDKTTTALGVHTHYGPSYITFDPIVKDGAQLLKGRDVDVRTMKRLNSKILALPEGRTRDFLQERVDTLSQLFSSAADVYTGDPPEGEENLAVKAFLEDGKTAGFLDAVINGNATSSTAFIDHWPAALNLINQIDYDKVGTSYFQGAIYTNGHFVADNEVNILGALILDGNGADKKSVTLGDGSSVELSSGDVYLANSTRITYVEEMFKSGDLDLTGPQLLARRLWIGR